MVAVPLLSGVAGTPTGEFVQSYPLNLEPVIVDSKISKGQLRAAPGAVQLGAGPGIDRAGIVWNGLLYRVMGTKLCSISPQGEVIQIGVVGGAGYAWLDYSFDRLIIGAPPGLYYYAPDTGLDKVTDEDLGSITDGMWIDGYTMVTDGTYIIVTELNDPMEIKPLKYGSAEEDPDPVTGLIKYRGEAYVLGRYTTQVLENVGGNGFPFITNPRAGFPFGCIGPQAKCLFGDGFAFVGSARNSALNVYVAGLGNAQPIGNREVCDALARVTDTSVIEVEARSTRGEQRLLVHLPDETWVFLLQASTLAGLPVWYRLKTDQYGYRCRHAVDAYGMQIVGDTQGGTFGYLSEAENWHFGVDPGAQFEAGLIYNEALGAIVHSVELVGLPGKGGEGAVFMSTTRDGETWGTEHSVPLRPGLRRRLAWRPHARIGNYLGLRFRFAGEALPGVAACEVKLAPLTS
jgi:hypothetical protein